jgi:cell division protein FtsX
VNDLDTRLERLAAAATRDAVPPELAAVTRRGRRRRRRQLAGSAALVAAVVAAGLVLPARLRPGPAPGDDTVTAPATDVTGAGMLGGYWFGKADASVHLWDGVDPARREAIRARLQALEVVDRVWFESEREASDRARVLYRNKPEALRKLDPATMGASFRVRLDDPAHFERLYRALCRPGAEKTVGQGCIDGVRAVTDANGELKPVLIARSWLDRSDVTIFLPEGTTVSQRTALLTRVRAIDVVTSAVYVSPDETFRQLPEKWRRALGALPVIGPDAVPASLRVTVEEPARSGEVQDALCDNRRTGACPGGLVVMLHPRTEAQAGAGAAAVRVRP